MMLKKCLVKVCLIALLVPGVAFAKNLPVTVKLSTIQSAVTSEKSGDEVYFSVTEYSNIRRPQEFRIPQFPTHWLSKHLNQVKDVKLWNGSLKEGEAVKLIMSLIEQDAPPFNIDDHIGSVKLTLANEKGTLTVKWGVPDFKVKPDTKRVNGQKSPKFRMRGDGGEYSVSFSVVQ